jgi:hypothetical protein
MFRPQMIHSSTPYYAELYALISIFLSLFESIPTPFPESTSPAPSYAADDDDPKCHPAYFHYSYE